LGPTTLWGYHPRVPLTGVVDPATGKAKQAHLGGFIVAQKGVPVQITFQNNLPTTHPLPVDSSSFFGDISSGVNKTAVHLHGGYVHWISDGGPFDWWTPTGVHGPSFFNNQVLNPTALPSQAEYYYPNNQSARLMWYHDHAHDITRLNAYAGVASAYIIRDAFEASLIPKGLPNFLEAGGQCEIPLVIQDKIFVDATTINYMDPDWSILPVPQTTGSLWYPHFYDYKRWTMGPGVLAPPAGLPPKPVSIIPEMFGDTMLVNGTAYPEVTVEPRRYRLRILNACNARYLNFQMYVEDPAPLTPNPMWDGITLDPVTLNPLNAAGPNWMVIGTEGGFLAKPTVVKMNVPFNPLTMKGSLITAPAERWDVIVDFSKFAGKNIILYNDAPAPFPGGDPLNDAYWNGPGSVTHPGPGFSPNTRQLLRFKVGATATLPADLPLGINIGTTLSAGLDPFLVSPWNTVIGGAVTIPTTIGGKAVKVRRLTLNEDFDQWGRLLQWIGTDTLPAGVPAGGSFGRAFLDGATEIVTNGDIEVWQIINLTADTHPMHFHLVDVQVLGRQAFNPLTYAGGVPTYMANATPPDPVELGWKETVRCNPGEVTTVIMQFKLPAPIAGVAIPLSSRVKDAATGLPVAANEYVWHCHILEHEEHDMMRPLLVK